MSHRNLTAESTGVTEHISVVGEGKQSDCWTTHTRPSSITITINGRSQRSVGGQASEGTRRNGDRRKEGEERKEGNEREGEGEANTIMLLRYSCSWSKASCRYSLRWRLAPHLMPAERGKGYATTFKEWVSKGVKWGWGAEDWRLEDISSYQPQHRTISLWSL